jgi:O-antigen ligase
VLLLIAFVGVVTIAFVRLMADRQTLSADASAAGLISEYLVNPVKWIIPGLLLFDGCRSRSRFLWALVSLLSLYVLLSVQVIRWMPPDAVFNYATLAGRSLRRLDTEIGYHRVNLSVMLAGASWALFAARTLVVSPNRRTLVLVTAGVVVFAQLLTGGRGGYFGWVVVGLTLGLLRWRRCLLLVPLLGIGLGLLPGVADRAFEGIFETDGSSSSAEVDMEKLTAGRNLIWAGVIDKIAAEPMIGYGREAMERTGLSALLSEEPGEPGPGNPHNAYLEMLLDNGWIGLAVALALFGYIVANSFSLTRDGRSPLFVAIGGVTSSLVIAQLAGSITGQSFYPREGTLGMWCAIGLMLRVSVERARAAVSFPMHGRAIGRTIPARLLEGWRPAAASRLGPATCMRPGPAPLPSEARSADVPL